MPYNGAQIDVLSTNVLTHPDTEFAPRPELDYPFKLGWHPQPGQPFEVADGVFWVRVPMPIALDHINLWLLRDGDGWVIVDSGFDAPMCKEVWETVFREFCSPEDVHRIIVTHFHPDHIGLASWLAAKCDCRVWMTRGEFEHYRQMLERDSEQHIEEALELVTEMGFDQYYKDLYVGFFGDDDKPPETRVQREVVEHFTEQDTFSIDGHQWRVVMGNGHSPEHACLLCEDKNVLISGDQALPRISSNVSVYVSNKNQDPLADWLASCDKLKREVAPDTLVLPSHQEPFVGIVARMEQLIY
ncbi:MAG: MBL fold metallo-hydrolase, partial [Gammaproteobacteria bacterium]|nr:MBL fold metallo-hydrolase [Gammaproteobacteria bacterium]